MRIAWLLFLLALILGAILVLLGDYSWLPVSTQQKALAGTVLGVGLSTIVSNITQLLNERSSRTAIKLTTLSSLIDISVSLGVVHSLLFTNNEIDSDQRATMKGLIEGAGVKVQEMADKLGENTLPDA